jgi:hypothetical protein
VEPCLACEAEVVATSWRGAALCPWLHNLATLGAELCVAKKCVKQAAPGNDPARCFQRLLRPDGRIVNRLAVLGSRLLTRFTAISRDRPDFARWCGRAQKRLPPGVATPSASQARQRSTGPRAISFASFRHVFCRQIRPFNLSASVHRQFLHDFKIARYLPIG